MRAREILQEDYNQSLQSDLTNLLVGAKGSGATQVSTQEVVMQLSNMGYAVDERSILSLLANNPVVQASDPEQITLTTTDGEGGQEDQDDSAQHVSNMARKATDLG